MNVPTPVRFLRKTWAAVAIALTVWSGIAAAQTIEGDLRIVKQLDVGFINRLAWSPDGQYVAVEALVETSVWEIDSGRRVRVLSGAPWRIDSGAKALAFAPDGKHLIVQAGPVPGRQGGSPGPGLAFGVWNIETGAMDGTFAGPVDASNRPYGLVHFAVGGGRLAVLFENYLNGIARGQVVVYDARTFEQLSAWATASNGGGDVAIDASGEQVAVTAAQELWVYDALSGRVLSRALQVKSIGYLGFVGSNRIATGPAALINQDDPAVLWDSATGKRVRDFPRNFGSAHGFSTSESAGRVSLNGGARSAGGVGHLWVWEAATGREIGNLAATETYFAESVFSPDGRYLAIEHLRVRRDTVGLLIVAVGSGVRE